MVRTLGFARTDPGNIIGPKTYQFLRTRRYADRMNLAAMTPRNDLSSTQYCLANPGKEYLVYLPDGGEVTVDPSAATGTLTVEWVHPVEGTVAPGGTTRGVDLKGASDGKAYTDTRE